jgi:hypothetical protein
MKVELNVEDMAVEVLVREKVDGEFVAVDTAAFGLDGIHESIRQQSDLYGLSKLLQDRSSSVPTGPDKLAAMNSVYAQFVAGEWEKERTRGAMVVSAEVEALAEMKGVSISSIQKTLASLTKEQKDSIFANPKVKKAADAIRTNREEAVDVDLTDLTDVAQDFDAPAPV